MKRIGLFLLTNIAILAVISIVLSLLGFQGNIDQYGNLNLTQLLIFSAVVGFTGSFISLFMSKWMAKRSTGAQVIEQPRNEVEQWLVATVRRQADQAGIRMPEVALYDAPEPNAFATGASRNNSLVAVSTGLMHSMTRDEVEAVLAHEVSHVANGDMVTLTLIQGVVNTFVVFLSRVVGYFVDRVVFKTEQGVGPGYYIASIVSQIIFGILASMVVAWFSRQREFRADAGGARLASASKMANALRRLQSQQQGGNPLPKEMTAMGIFGLSAGGFQRLFMTHPPLEERIAALEKPVLR